MESAKKALAPIRLSFAAGGWYLFYFSSRVCLQPFYNVYFSQQGLSDREIGILGTIRPWLSTLSSFIWCSIADNYQLHNQIMLSLFILATIIQFSILLLHTFPAFVCFIILVSLIGSTVPTLADSVVIQALDKSSEYGKHRMWGAVGWGIFSSVAGTLITYAGGLLSAALLQVILAFPALFFGWHLCRLKDAHKGSSNKDGQSKVPSVMPASGKPGGSLAGGREDAFTLANAALTNAAVLGAPHLEAPPLPIDPERAAPHLGTFRHGTTVATGYEEEEGLELVGLHGGHEDSASPSLRPRSRNKLLRVFEQKHIDEDAELGLGLLGVDGSEAEGEGKQLKSRLVEKGKVGALRSDPALTGLQPAGVVEVEDGRLRPRSAAPAAEETSCSRAQGPDTSLLTYATFLVSHPHVILFLGMVLIMGFGFGIIENFMFLLLEEMGGTETLMGMTLTVTCMSEVLVFYYQERVIDLLGADTLLHITIATYVLRLLLYSVLPWFRTPWAVLPIELLHGITFGAGWGAGAVKAKSLAPPGMEATMMATFSGLYFGFGYGIGGLTGGVLSHQFGLRRTFSIAAGIMTAAWTLAACTQWRLGRPKLVSGPMYMRLQETQDA